MNWGKNKNKIIAVAVALVVIIIAIILGLNSCTDKTGGEDSKNNVNTEQSGKDNKDDDAVTDDKEEEYDEEMGLQVVDPEDEQAIDDNSIDISEFFDEDDSSDDKKKEDDKVKKEEIEIEDKETVCVKEKHSIQHVKATPATLDKTGNIEYWYCKKCKEYYADKDCTRVIKNGKKAVVIPVLSDEDDEDVNIKVDKEETDCVSKKHNVSHVRYVAATETKDGNIEYWYCRECDTYYADEKCTEVIVGGKEATIIPAIPVIEEKTDCVSKEHDVKHVEEKKATKEEEGNIEYWYCKDCDKYYKDAACTQLIIKGKQDVVIPKLPENLEEDTPGWGRFY